MGIEGENTVYLMCYLLDICVFWVTFYTIYDINVINIVQYLHVVYHDIQHM